MMNAYSKRGWASVLLAGALVAGCGGDSGGGAAPDKSDWDKRHGAAVKAVSLDVDAANGALDKGDRPVILSSCNQLQEDLADARKSLPVPDATVDGALRPALDAAGAAATTCIQGGRTANDNKIVEQAQREMKDARARLDDAQKAIAAWQ
jgi:hypothetical protein